MAGSAPDGASYWGLDFRHAYVPGTSLTGAGQVLGVVEFDGYTPGDIQAYESLSGLPGSVPLQNVLMDSVTNVPGPNNSEVALDIELAIAMAPGLLKVVVYEGASDVDIMNEIANPTQSEPLPNQISCSWGISGDPNIVPALIQMALQGQSFFYASGDHGAYPNGTDNTTQQSMNYMTAVGGTHLTMQGKGVSYVSETVWNNDPNDASAGGVLTAVPIPDFQKPVDMSRNQGSTQHRNIPDVAISADNVYFVATVLNTNGTPPVTGRPFDEQGTSGAAPLWAGFAALVNEQAAAQGKPPVGFLNPAIYTIAEGALYASCFHDITNGNNITPTSGNLYSAAPGYDLCTGWGSPTGATLINALVGLSGPVFVDFNYTGFIADGSYDFPFSTLAGGINAVSPGGTIFIKTAGSSSETMTISKPMTITASDGAATIGH
jgi:subtilase family serine protease